MGQECLATVGAGVRGASVFGVAGTFEDALILSALTRASNVALQAGACLPPTFSHALYMVDI